MRELVLEKNKELPQGWSKISFGNYLHLEYGKGLAKNLRNNLGTIPVYGSSGIIGYHDKFLISESCLIVGRKGSAGEIHYVNEPCYAIDTTYYLKQNSLFDLKFLYYLLKSIQSKFIDSSTAIPSLRRDDVHSTEIILPPLNEQKRIVAKIEELFSLLESTKEILEKTKILLKQYRQSILKNVFEGKNSENWQEIKLEDVTEKAGTTNPKEYPNKEFFYCDIASVDNKNLKIKNPKHFLGRDAPSRARQLVHHNDVIFSTVRTYLHNIAMIPSKLDTQLCSTGFCVLRGTDQILNKFIFYLVQTMRFENYLNPLQRGTSYPAVRNNDIFNFKFLLPPLNEQKRIVEKIEESFSLIEKNEKIVDSLLLQYTYIKNSILKQAFEGKLVIQDPNDEHAEILLEKIKQEKLLIQKQKASRSTKNVK